MRRPTVPGQPQPTVTVDARIARDDIMGLDLVGGEFFEVADEACAGQVGGAPGLVVRETGVRVPPREGEGDVGAGAGVAGGCADRQGEEGRVAAVFAVSQVVRQGDWS